jgi:hypothetical protein
MNEACTRTRRSPLNPSHVDAQSSSHQTHKPSARVPFVEAAETIGRRSKHNSLLGWQERAIWALSKLRCSLAATATPPPFLTARATPTTHKDFGWRMILQLIDEVSHRTEDVHFVAGRRTRAIVVATPIGGHCSCRRICRVLPLAGALLNRFGLRLRTVATMHKSKQVRRKESTSKSTNCIRELRAGA